jgi:hypothetical protein
MSDGESIHDDRRFWQSLALHQKFGGRTARTARVGAVEPELESLLWALAEDELPDADAARLYELAAQDPRAVERLGEILDTIADIEASPAPTASVLLAKFESARPAKSSGTAAPSVKLAVRLLASGLESLFSSGSALFAPATVRSGEPAETTSIVEEFLLSCGVIQVILDRQADDRCGVSVRIVRLTPGVKAADLECQLVDDAGATLQAGSFAAGYMALPQIEPGAYRLNFLSSGRQQDSLEIEILPT